jgi:cytoskeletal protein CcmA (bactofilin family)
MSNQSHGAPTKRTFVEEGTQFKGSLTSSCPIEVKGGIEGDVVAPALDVSATGSVKGKVRVQALRSQGELAGEFDADVVQLAGVVKDNTVIRAKSLEVKLAAEKGRLQVIFGECELEIGDPAARTDAVVPEPTAEAAAEAPPPAGEIPGEVPAEAASEDKPTSERPRKRKSQSNGSIAPEAEPTNEP